MRPGDFAESVDQHYTGLVRRLALVLHDADEAQDIAQETYLRAWRSWDRFDGTDARAWLHTIGLRLAFNRRRGRNRLTAWLGGQSHAMPVWVPGERVDLWRALSGLRPEERAALLLNIVDGYTQAEIAVLLNIPPGTVAGWIANAKRHLRDALADRPMEVPA
jgi:RNA polymerase sigma-70 factor (ECF subfamily)